MSFKSRVGITVSEEKCMGNNGNLHIGELQKHKEDLNKTGGINTQKAVFNTSGDSTDNDNPYALGTRVEQLANRGPLMDTRIHTQNPNDVAFGKAVKKEKQTAGKTTEGKVRSREGLDMIKAQPDLKVFSGEVMKKGAFTPRAKEAARHFFKQVSDWAGSFDDGGTGFYSELGINNVMDCLYVDGMSLRRYLNEQYYYKTTGKPAQDAESMRNYLALIAARGDHIITLVRPNANREGAEIEYKNLYVNLDNVGEDEAANTRKHRETGNHVRSRLKKRMDEDMTERVGMAYRKAYGKETEGFKRIEGAKAGLAGAEGETSKEYKAFSRDFDSYNGGLQKLGLKPGRDDINLRVAEELKKRCEDAIKSAEEYLRSEPENEEAVKAVKRAKEALETDMECLDRAIKTKLDEDGARMRLDELFDTGKPQNPPEDRGDGDDSGADEGQDPE